MNNKLRTAFKGAMLLAFAWGAGFFVGQGMSSKTDIKSWYGQGSKKNTDEVRIDSSGNILPGTDNENTLGSTSLRWSTVYALDQTIGDDLTVTDALAVNGNTTIGNAGNDVFTINSSTWVTNTWGVFFATATTGTRAFAINQTNKSIAPGSATDVDDALTPRYAGEIIYNATDKSLCMSTSTASTAWVKVASPTIACAQ